MAQWSPIPLRLIVGYGFMQHGFAKLSRGPDTFAAILQGMGVPDPHLMAWLTILTELLGGLAVLLGAFVTIVSVPMTAVLLVAMFKVHLQYGFSSIKLLEVTATGAKFGPVGYEVILLYIACIAALVMGGSGPFAIDGLVRERSKREQVPAGSLQLLCGDSGSDIDPARPGERSRVISSWSLAGTWRQCPDPSSGRDTRIQGDFTTRALCTQSSLHRRYCPCLCTRPPADRDTVGDSYPRGR